MTIQEQTQYLGWDKLNAMDRLNVLLPSFYLTGSLSLFEYGVVKRKINDLDICVRNMDFLYRLEDAGITVDRAFDYETPAPKESRIQLKGKIPNRARLTLAATDVCVFYVPEEEETITCDYLVGRKFRVAHPRYAIAAKERYVKNILEITAKQPLTEAQEKRLYKHQSDIEAYHRWLWWRNPELKEMFSE